MSNGLKRATEKKQIEFSAVLEKSKYLKEKKKHLIDLFFTYHYFLFKLC